MDARSMGSSLVLDLLDELRQQDAHGDVRVRLGRAKCDEQTFRRIFERFSAGTYLEGLDLEIEEVPREVGCDCGYSRRITDGGYLSDRQCPRCGKELAYTGGDEFEVITRVQ